MDKPLLTAAALEHIKSERDQITDLREIAKGVKMVHFMVVIPDRRPGAPIGAMMTAQAKGLGDLFATVIEQLADARDRIALLEAALKEKG